MHMRLTFYRIFKIQCAEWITRQPKPFLNAIIIPRLVLVALHPVSGRNIIPLRTVWMANNRVRNFQGCSGGQGRLMPLYVGKLTCHFVNNRQSEIAVKHAPGPGEYPEPKHFRRLDYLRSDPIFACACGVDLIGFYLPQTGQPGSVPDDEPTFG